ncbi:thiamine pyrophosphate-dependent enzyme [Micromonospora sp. NPDC047644]|uniref:thiamine pyrophosphate-dependent enzyme n=1 Tax=Micromonospora sp. NPDC047644 TaxID=3157203 RepID=UPI003454B076
MVCAVLRIAGAYKITFCRPRLDHVFWMPREQGVHPGPSRGVADQRAQGRIRLRERLNITNVILDNHGYAILRQEWGYVSQRPGPANPDTNPLFDLTNPQIDFVGLATAFGMPATRATTAEELAEQFSAALNQPGPLLIDATLPPAA